MTDCKKFRTFLKILWGFFSYGWPYCGDFCALATASVLKVPWDMKNYLGVLLQKESWGNTGLRYENCSLTECKINMKTDCVVGDGVFVTCLIKCCVISYKVVGPRN